MMNGNTENNVHHLENQNAPKTQEEPTAKNGGDNKLNVKSNGGPPSTLNGV